MLKLSIITINRNNRSGLEKTIQSVVTQTSGEFEYIVIDGASTDGSVEVIEQFNNSTIEHFRWVSEPDTGIYNAMNKGILKAKGEYLLFLNSGDWLVDENVVIDFIKNVFGTDIVYGDLNYVYGNDVKMIKIPEKLNLEYFWWHSLPHQSVFFRRNLFEQFGLYNENYKCLADWDFCMKTIVLNNCSYKHFNRLISNFDTDGISSNQTSEFIKLKTEEREMVFLQLGFIYKSYDELRIQNQFLKENIEEYHFLENGKFGFIVKFMRQTKQKLKYKRK